MRLFIGASIIFIGIGSYALKRLDPPECWFRPCAVSASASVKK